jgi:hypothetical protein
LSKRFKIFVILVGVVSCLNTSLLHGQFLKDSSSIKLIKKGIDCIYNFDFNSAEKIRAELGKLYPGHPVTFLFRGMMTYWMNYPLVSTSPERVSFEEDMHKTIDLCEANKDQSAEAEILLVNLCARGLLLLYLTDNYLSLEVFPLATSTYQHVRRCFNFTSSYSDFYFFTGVYNYYREAYPEAYPVYRTLAFLFPRGSKVKGLEDLQIVAKNSIVLKAESYSFLSAIFLTFENNYQQATFYSKSLHYIYPDNPAYLGAYIKNLLLIKQYDEAEKEIMSSNTPMNNAFFQAQVTIFKGILEEKKYHNNVLAQQYYNKGIKDISVFRSFGNEYAAYAYFGLSRISELNGKTDDQKMYRKLALKLADFKKVDFD